MALVSVIVATFDGERFVRATIESILAQDHPAVEVLVCDDGSTDGTLAALRSFGDRIRLFEQPNSGVSAARNRAAAEARGDFLAFLDQDDLWDPDLLRTQLALLEQNPQCGLAHADSRVIDAAGTVHGLRSSRLRQAEGRVFADLLEGNFVPLETMVLRTDLFRELGGFRNEYRLLEDYELCLRAARVTSFALTRRPLASYRVHATNVTHDMQSVLEEYVRVLEELDGVLPALSVAERDHARAVLRRRHAELAWYALRRLDLQAADLHMQQAGPGGAPRLRLKVRALRTALRLLPSPMDRALVGLLPRRRLYGV